MAFGGPTLLLNDIVQITPWCQMGDQAGLNVLHFRVTGVSVNTPNLLGRVADAWVSLAIPGAYKSLLTMQASYKGILIRVLHPTLSPVFQDDTGNGVGTGGMTDALPRQVCGFMRKINSVPGQRSAGRIYVPFPSEERNQSAGVPDAVYTTNLGVLSARLMSDFTWGADSLGKARLIILKRSNPLLSGQVSSLQTFALWATQRRRGSFGRPNVSPF